MRLILNLLFSLICICSFSCNPTISAEMEAELKEKLKSEIESELNKQNMKPYLIHTVFFWIKDGTSDADVKFFEEGLVRLGTCPQIGEFYWGPPASTEQRGVVDASYNYAINVHFGDLESQAEYQNEPIHLKFIDDHKEIWEKVIVYDNVVK